MLKVNKKLVRFILVLVISSLTYFVRKPDSQTYLVTNVVDGDTIDVLIEGKSERVRLIGINTPESVDPRKPVECYAAQASEKLSDLILNKFVRLERDTSQSNIDRYGRLLRYVFLEPDTNVNLEMIRGGYAYEYTYDAPYKYQKAFKDAQYYASNSRLGLWNPLLCPARD